MLHSSGRWRRGSHWPKSSRKLKIRSFARARSSSRRAPPNAASKPCSSIASSSVVVCSRLRDARGPVSSTTRPVSIDSCTDATISRSPSSATRRSRNSRTSGKLWPVSTCMSGNGNGAGRNAFSARRSSTIESLPPLKSSTGLDSSAATSRMMWIASDSRTWRCVSSCVPMPPPGPSGIEADAPAARPRRRRPGCRDRRGRRADPSDVQPALRLVGPRPAPRATVAGQRARRAADRRVALVVERVVGQVALVDAPPEVLLGPAHEGVVLPHRALLVPLDRLRVRPGRRLLAADPGDPRVGARERALERGDLGGAAALLRSGPRAGRVLDLDLHAEALLERAPGAQRLGEQHAGVDRDDARVGRQPDELVDEHRLLLLEGAEQDELRVVALDGLGEHGRDVGRRGGGVAQIAHSPSPRITSNGALRDQSMKWFMFSSENSIGSARSRASSSNRFAPTRSAKALNASPSRRSASYMRTQRSTASGTRLAARRAFRRVPYTTSPPS